MPVERLSHIGVCVTDLERSIRFYRDVLGFQERSRLEVAGEPSQTLLELENVELQAVYLERDGTRIELLYYASPGHQGDGSPRPMNGLGLTHLSLRVADLDTTAEAIRQAGGRVIERSRIDLPSLRTRALFVTDPDGTRLELVEGPAAS